MKSIKNLVLAVVTFCVWGGLNAQPVYYPLEKGQVQTYRYSNAFNNGNTNLMLKIEVLDVTENINGKEYLIVQTSYGSEGKYTVVSTIYMRTMENGAVVNIENKEQPQEQIFLDQPFEVGKSWEIMSKGELSASTIIDIDGSIKTPDKTYSNCLVLEGSKEDSKTRVYLQENVGMVAITMILGEEEKLMVYLAD